MVTLEERSFNSLFDNRKIANCDFLLSCLKKIKNKYNKKYTLLAICPNSESVIKTSIISAKKNDAPLIFAATLNQIDTDYGYTNMNFSEFLDKVNFEVKDIDFEGPMIIGIDHGGPWLKDRQVIEDWDLQRSMDGIKRSFEQAVLAGYNLIHVDPTIDKSLHPGEIIDIKVVVDRTVELICHIEKFRRDKNLPKVSYEVGTEEVHGGLADIYTFKKFLKLLRKKLELNSLLDVWPCFVVGKVGTDLHTTYFDSSVAKKLVKEAGKYGSFIKGHYTDYVENPSDYPKSGMGGANIGPELTEVEFNALIKLSKVEEELIKSRKINCASNIEKTLEKAVYDSGRWKKWLNEKEKNLNFYQLSPERRSWLIKTGARYIWTNPQVLDARKLLEKNLLAGNMNSEELIKENIIKRLDKYFNAFNLVGLNTKIFKS